MKNLKTLFIITLIIYGCKNTNVKYYTYSNLPLLTENHVGYFVVDCILVEKKLSSNKSYYSQYICRDDEKNTLIRVFTNCTSRKIEKGQFVGLFVCNEEYIAENLHVASSDSFEKIYKNLPVYYGNLSIPVE